MIVIISNYESAMAVFHDENIRTTRHKQKVKAAHHGFRIVFSILYGSTLLLQVVNLSCALEPNLVDFQRDMSM
jgi:hypothetical protein